MIAFVAAIQFLLLTPAFIRREFTPAEMGRAVGLYPLVGLMLGGVLALADALLGDIYPLTVRSALVLTLWIILTGGLHIDGFLDSCDGLLGGWTPERRLEIMRDERVGAYGVAGGVVLLITLFSSLSAVTSGRWAALLLAPGLARWGISLSIVIWPYARSSGLGRDIKDHAHTPQLVLATITALASVAGAAFLLHGAAPAVALLAAGVILWLSTRFILARIPGMTGDAYGAVNMLIEAGVLLVFAAMK